MLESYELPLFPLHTVLFPGQMLPLRVFEPRYQQMMDDCLQGERVFGVALIQSGSEVGQAAIPHLVGTSAAIQNIARLPNGQRHIITRGNERFRIEDYWDTEEPYLMCRASSWPWRDSLYPDDELVQAVGRRLEQYVDLWSRANDVEISLERLPQEPTRLAMLSAIALQVSLRQKQALLEIPSVDELLQRLDGLLDDENRALQILLAAASRRGEMDGAFSQN
jgi:Lon protease-like protein